MTAPVRPQPASDRGIVCIFIDGNNLFHAARAVNVEIDYSRLLEFLVDDDRLIRANFYTGVKFGNDDHATRQHGFLYWMRHNGFRVVQKELRRTAEGTYRADLSVELATDMLTLAPRYDTAILVTGNEDFSYAVDAVTRMGARVEVAMFRSSVSQRLIEVSDAFIDLEAEIDVIAKNPGSYTPKQRFVETAREGEDDGYEDEGYEDEA